MYIFLDVDGVLNTKQDWKRKVYSLNPHSVEAFNRLMGNGYMISTYHLKVESDGLLRIELCLEN